MGKKKGKGKGSYGKARRTRKIGNFGRKTSKRKR